MSDVYKAIRRSKTNEGGGFLERKLIRGVGPTPGGPAAVRPSEAQRQRHTISTATGRLQAMSLPRLRPHRDKQARGRHWSPEVADDGPIRVFDFKSPVHDRARFR